jgi:TRAP transporter TAXI family solute receptor
MAAAYVSFLDEALNVNLTVLPGAASENVKTVSKQEAEFGMGHSTTCWMGAQGIGPYDQKYEGVMLVAPLFPAAFQPYVLPDSPITSISQCGNVRFGYGIAGGTGNYFIQQFMEEEYKITPDTIVANGGSVSYLSEGEAPGTLADKQVDITTTFGTYPRTQLQQIENNPGLRLIDLASPELDHFLGNHPEWSRFTIPAGSYVGQDKDITTVSTYSIFFCHETVDEELVYNITKALWLYQAEAGDASVEVKNWMKMSDIPNCTGAISLHPGAERFYKEIGLI